MYKAMIIVAMVVMFTTNAYAFDNDGIFTKEECPFGDAVITLKGYQKVFRRVDCINYDEETRKWVGMTINKRGNLVVEQFPPDKFDVWTEDGQLDVIDIATDRKVLDPYISPLIQSH